MPTNGRPYLRIARPSVGGIEALASGVSPTCSSARPQWATAPGLGLSQPSLRLRSPDLLHPAPPAAAHGLPPALCGQHRRRPPRPAAPLPPGSPLHRTSPNGHPTRSSCQAGLVETDHLLLPGCGSCWNQGEQQLLPGW